MTRLDTQVAPLLTHFSGTAGIMIGSQEEIYFSYNSDCTFPAASIIKLFILWEFFRQVESNQIDPNQKISLMTKERTFGCGVMAYFSDTTRLPLWDLATLMIIVSDNWATNLLIDQLGLESINQTCQKEG